MHFWISIHEFTISIIRFSEIHKYLWISLIRFSDIHKYLLITLNQFLIAIRHSYYWLPYILKSKIIYESQKTEGGH